MSQPAFAVQWGTGVIIDLWPPTTDGGYHPDGYQAAFAVILAIQAASLIWYFVYRGDATN